MKQVDPRKPIRADHRMIKDILGKQSGDVQHVHREYEIIAKVFEKAGGSWERIFRGSPDDIVLLKKLCKVAVTKGFITKGGFQHGNEDEKG